MPCLWICRAAKRTRLASCSVVEVRRQRKKCTTTVSFCFYLRQGECSEHWRRLRDWSFCPSFRVCVYMMTHNSNDVISQAQGTSSNAGYYFSIPFPCRKVALPSPSPFLAVGCSCRCLVVVSLVVVVMFRSLQLAEIYTLTSAF